MTKLQVILTAIVFAVLGYVNEAWSQTTFTMPPPAGVQVMGMQVVSTCASASGLVAGNVAFAAMDTTGTICTGTGGGGGGLSVTDNSAWTNASSKFTPNGGVFNDSATALSSGNQGTVRLNANREMHVTCDTGNVLCAAIQAAVPYLPATTPTTNTYTTNVTSPTNGDLHGAFYVHQTPQTDTVAGTAPVKGGIGVVNGASTYQHVAASQTAAVLQTSTGAIGDYLSHCVIYPSTTAAGSVTVFDNANAASTNVIEFTTGTLSNLAPIAIPVGAVSTAGAWKVTTGANETVVCYGKFS